MTLTNSMRGEVQQQLSSSHHPLLLVYVHISDAQCSISMPMVCTHYLCTVALPCRVTCACLPCPPACRLLAGESGVQAIDRFDASDFPTRFAAQIKNFDDEG
jgi:3-oxoacyl-(acyl-carrier-protein) synthase